MAVQAGHLSHDFPAVMGGSLFLDEYAGCVPAAPAVVAVDTTVLSDFPASELTGNNNYGFVPRKRGRVLADSGGFSEDHRLALPPSAMQGLAPLPVTVGNDVRSRAVGSGAPSTSGRVADGGATVSLCNLGGEIDALIRLESERMRAVLEEARRRHAQAVLAAVARAAAGRVRAAEAELARALRRNAELEEKARQVAAECQAWMGVARSHEAVAAGLRAAVEQLLQPPGAAAAGDDADGDAEDARSCCFDESAPAPGANDAGAESGASKTCRSCGGGEACVLLLPCRHLCLCRACEASVDACPVCAAAKNASLLVLVS